MKTLEYQGREYDLNKEQKKDYKRNVETYNPCSKFLVGMMLAGLLVSPIGIKGHIRTVKIENELKGDKRYEEYLVAQKKYVLLRDTYKFYSPSVPELERDIININNKLERLTAEAKKKRWIQKRSP